MTILPKHSIQGNTIFTTMSALAAEHNAVNLSQGFPDFEIDNSLSLLIQEAVKQNYNQYAPMAGLPALREAIAQDFQKRYALKINPATEITITPGATYGIYTALTSILQPGDEVIIFEPAYDSYLPNIEMNGGKAVAIPLSFPDFSVDWAEVKDKITSKTKAIIVNTPHNPTGSIWSQEDWDCLIDLIADKNIFIISDEVYEQLVFDGKKHISVLEQEPIKDRSFAVFSFGKVFNNTGWKVGYTIAPEKLTHAFRALHQYLCFSVNTPSQYAIARYMSSGKLPNLSAMMQDKRDYFLEKFKNTAFDFLKPTSGSYFQLSSYKNISPLSDTDFAVWLTQEYGLATIPLSPFYSTKKDDQLIRFCFAKMDETIAKAADKVKNLVG